MAKWLTFQPGTRTNPMLATILSHGLDERVQFLVPPGLGEKIIRRFRTSISRSRERNRRQNKKLEYFTFRHEIYKYTDANGNRHDAVVVWKEKTAHHASRELLDDLLERG